MRSLNRRDFLQKSAGLAGISMLAPHALINQPLDLPAKKFALGFQSWVVREPLNQDFAGTLKKMASQGYQSIEMCSPVGYSKAGFAPLEKMPVKEMKRIMKGEGISCESSHFTFRELENNIEASIEFAQELGLKQMVVSSTGLREDATIYDWKKAAGVMNRWGMLTKKEGLPFAFHNHNLEF
ncbi:MAG: sugar phosphate isomerase/epimerase family protein, partial [Rhodothermales bacterium]